MKPPMMPLGKSPLAAINDKKSVAPNNAPFLVFLVAMARGMKLAGTYTPPARNTMVSPIRVTLS